MKFFLVFQIFTKKLLKHFKIFFAFFFDYHHKFMDLILMNNKTLLFACKSAINVNKI